MQEHIQKSNSGNLSYELIREEGPDHNKTFEVALYLNNTITGRGKGHSKKDAQQAAAKDALKGLGVRHE